MPAEAKEGYSYADTDLNLAKMEMETIHRAYELYPTAPVEVLSIILGISDRNLYRKIKEYNINPNKIRVEARKKLLDNPQTKNNEPVRPK